MDLSDHYAVDESGRLVYASKFGISKNYLIWGIAEHGFLHGVGGYLRREDFTFKGIPFITIDTPTYQEIEDYYKSLDKFWGDKD